MPSCVWSAGAVPMLIEIVKEGTSAVQSAVVALEKLCSHSSGWSSYPHHAFHNQLHTPNKEKTLQNCIFIMFFNTRPSLA